VMKYPSWPSATGDQEGFPLPLSAPQPAQSHVTQPVQDDVARELFLFDAFPETAITHFNVSCHSAQAPPPYSDYAGSTSTQEAFYDASHMGPSAYTKYMPAQPLESRVHSPLTPAVSSLHQGPEAIPRPASPADSVRAIGEIRDGLLLVQRQLTRGIDSWG
jgi:hypothetical protein